MNQTNQQRPRRQRKQARSLTDNSMTYSERDAAKKLGISYITLFRKRKAGEVPFYRIGTRVLYDDQCLVVLLQKSKQATAAAA